MLRNIDFLVERKELKKEIEPLRKQKLEYDFFFSKERFLKDALYVERNDNSTLLGENITLKERNKDLEMDLQDTKCHRKSCLEKIDHQREALNVAEEKHSYYIATAMTLRKDLKAANVRISELGENKSLHLEKIKYLEIQLNSFKKSLNESHRRESDLVCKVTTLERKIEVWESNKRKRIGQ